MTLLIHRIFEGDKLMVNMEVVRFYNSICQVKGLVKTKYPINLILIILIFFTVNSKVKGEQGSQIDTMFFWRAGGLNLSTYNEYKRPKSCFIINFRISWIQSSTFFWKNLFWFILYWISNCFNTCMGILVYHSYKLYLFFFRPP